MSVTYCRAGIEIAGVGFELVLGELCELGLGIEYKCTAGPADCVELVVGQYNGGIQRLAAAPGRESLAVHKFAGFCVHTAGYPHVADPI